MSVVDRTGALRPADGLMNIALGKAASQSSYWHVSQPGEAANAVSGRFVGDFAFHTDEDDGPWWQVDLGASYPIEAIVVHNRLSACRDRARTLQIEIAEKPGAWLLIHAGFAEFGARGNGRPFESWIGGALQGRYVRISLRGKTYLHLSQVEVLIRQDRLLFEAYRSRYGLANFQSDSSDFGRPYGIEIPDGARADRIVGLKLSYSGRFGNLVQQYTHMIQLARATGLRYVQLGRNALFDIKQAFTVDGITFLPADAALPAEGAFITGSFFHSDTFIPLLSPFLRFEPADEVAYSFIAREYLRPHILTGIPLPDERHFQDEVTIHIRSGDLFDGDQAGNLWYRQPPLSFYKLVIERLRRAGVINRVRLVFEDRGNPCIEQLETWLAAHAIAYRTQCGTLHEDMSALIDAPHLVFGYGTFGYAACRLSKRIETLHFFTPELGGSYADIPCIENVFAVSDAEGSYIKAGKWNVSAGEWRNTAEQRATMVTYPAEHLRVGMLRRRGAPLD